MGKSTNGPDMQDCLLYLREIEESQQCSVTVMMEPDGFGSAPRWRIHVLGVAKMPTVTGHEAGVAAYAHWPHRESATFEGALFKCLALLDAEFGRREFQQVLGLT